MAGLKNPIGDPQYKIFALILTSQLLQLQLMDNLSSGQFKQQDCSFYGFTSTINILKEQSVALVYERARWKKHVKRGYLY